MIQYRKGLQLNRQATLFSPQRDDAVATGIKLELVLTWTNLAHVLLW